jgi:hypothetical protein
MTAAGRRIVELGVVSSVACDRPAAGLDQPTECGTAPALSPRQDPALGKRH